MLYVDILSSRRGNLPSRSIQSHHLVGSELYFKREGEQVEEGDSRGSGIVFANRQIQAHVRLSNSFPSPHFSPLDLLLSRLIDEITYFVIIYSFNSWDWCWTCVSIWSWVDCLVRFCIVGFISSSLEFELLVRSLIAFLLVLDVRWSTERWNLMLESPSLTWLCDILRESYQLRGIKW